MLKKEQLEDMTKCGFSPGCSWCINSNNSGIGDTVLCIENAAHTALELMDKTEAQEKEIQQLTEEIRVLREQLPDGDTDFHNSRDVKCINELSTLANRQCEVLKQARESLKDIGFFEAENCCESVTWSIAKDAIEAIDKVIGGGQSERPT